MYRKPLNRGNIMLTEQKISLYNSILIDRLSVFLNLRPDFIKPEIINELVRECGVSREYAFSVVLAAALGLDTEGKAEDRELFESYFPHMIRYLDEAVYQSDPYYKNIKIPQAESGLWELKTACFKPYEAFVCNDLNKLGDGRIIPQIGFFDCEFPYPVVLEGGREWMLITPNEIETMKPAVGNAFGKVLTLGLGLGYFAYMVSEKGNVTSVTVVERDERVINMFKKHILPQFPHAEKIKIVCGDAFSYAETQMAEQKYDFVFTDLWHDPSDGVDMYLKMKSFEHLSPQSTFMYWIEKTLLCYLHPKIDDCANAFE